jgi:hypothetical protein
MSQAPLSDALAQQAVDLVEQHGSINAAARASDIPRNTFKNRLDVARRRGINTLAQKREVLHGWSPENDLTQPIPSPLIVRGTSSLYKDGELKLQWVKTKLDDLKAEAAMRAAVEAMAEHIPRAKPSEAPIQISDNLCSLYTFTDCHVGQKSWQPETGADWDLQIAEQTLTKAFDYLVDSSPPAAVGIVNNLGDWQHYDSLNSVTPLHGNLLDSDSRFSKMVKVSIRILRYIIDKALTKHGCVIVAMNEGNHDLASAVWLRHLFSLLYENEPRVTVIDNETPYSVYCHGLNFIGFHHGHLAKKEALPLLFAATYPKEWGSTKFRVVHTGHMHHTDEKEYAGMTVKQHRTIAAPDAHSARGGYVSGREIEAITYHAQYGQVSTVTVTPDMLS